MASSRADVEKVALPPGVKAGVVVGRGGHNVKWLHFHSGGAHITVNDTGVVVRAKDKIVRARAIQLVRRQLEAAARLANAGPPSSPCTDFFFLECAFGTYPRVRFFPRNDEVVIATGHKDKLFELVPVPHGETQDTDVYKDSPLAGLASLPIEASCSSLAGSSPLGGSPAMSRQLSNASCASSSASRDDLQDWVRDQDVRVGCRTERKADAGGQTSARFYAASCRSSSGGGAELEMPTLSRLLSLVPAGRALTEAANRAARHEPRFEALKLRFKLGKSLFRNVGPLAGMATLSLDDLWQGSGSGRGACQSTFSGYVPSGAMAAVVSWLTCHLGFSLVESKTSATFHVINQELNVHSTVALAMERGDDTTAVLRKVKAGATKCHTTTLLSAPNQLDLRVKLISQHREQLSLAHDADAHATARRIAAAVRCDGFEGFTRSKRGLPRNRHLEYARRKTKSVYEGLFGAADEYGSGLCMRITITQVQDHNGTHYEISGCLPGVDSELRKLVRHPASAPVSEPQAAPAVSAWHGSPAAVAGDSDWALQTLNTLSAFATALNQHTCDALESRTA